MTWTVAMAGRFYGVQLTDYGEDRGGGVLVASGSGLLLAVMDVVPALRWCVDIDVNPSPRLRSFLEMASAIARPVGFAGWFTVTRPESVAETLAGLDEVLVYGGNHEFGAVREARSLAGFIERLQDER